MSESASSLKPCRVKDCNEPRIFDRRCAAHALKATASVTRDRTRGQRRLQRINQIDAAASFVAESPER